jgi:hypothetical protein
VLAMAAPAAAATAPKPLKAKSATLRSASIERQYCAIKVTSGRGVAKVTLKAPVTGTVSVRTRGARGAEWDVAIVDRKRRMVLTGSAQRGAREFASTFVRKGQKLAIQGCRQDGSAKLRVRYAFTKLPKAKSSDYATKLVRVGITSQSKARLEALGLDLTDHPTETYWDALLHSAADEAKLKKAGFDFTTRIADVAARDRANRRKEQRSANQQAQGNKARISAVPSGRTSYRTLPEIESDLRALAEANPNLVRLFALPGRSWEGREILGIEIAENVGATDDGRPYYVQVGTHHAREWPANEATLEWGIELINGYKAGNPRLAGIVKNARNMIVPVLNVDGFDVTIQSEGLTPGGNYTDPLNSGTAAGSSGAATGAYKRKNCRPEDGVTPPTAADCLARSYPSIAANADDGVDINRNYGVEWGGPGTATNPYPDPDFQTSHGPAPWSEPETRAFRDFVRNIQPTVLITNHTFTGLLLRPPGTNRFGPVPDEERLKFLGDAMARETDYISQYSYQLYDTTGTTDDYLYDALGSFSYTPEIGKTEFHPAYSEFVAEYEGRPETDRYGTPTGRQLGGLREAYTLAGETAIDRGSHSVLQGSAPAGRTLRIRKTVTYQTSDRPDDDGVQYPVQTLSDDRESVLTVPANGQFTWHVNPSRQPRDFSQEPDFWRLTCEDGAGNVLEQRNVYVERSQVTNLALSCGQNTTPTEPDVIGSCGLPDGFTKVNVRRRGKGLRILFTRKGHRNPVRIEVFQTSKGRTIYNRAQRRAVFNQRKRSFNWSGRGSKGKRLSNGVYYVRFRTLDASKRLDSRRVVVARKHGRFAKKPGFYLVDRCP